MQNLNASTQARCMPANDLPQLLDQVTARVTLAGDLLVVEWAWPEGSRGQGDKAEVDVEIKQQLREELLRLLDCDFWGEETGHVLTGHPWCWVIDPNDGTSDFLKGRKSSAISVGLLRDGIPVLGVVCAPVTEDRGPDCIAWAEGLPHPLRNGQSVAVDLSQQGLAAGSAVMLSAAAAPKPELNTELCAPEHFVAMPSIAYRLARVAAGDGVCAVSLFPLSAHDVVAGPRAAARQWRRTARPGWPTDHLPHRGEHGHRLAALFWGSRAGLLGVAGSGMGAGTASIRELRCATPWERP